jgi:hypothetical protein
MIEQLQRANPQIKFHGAESTEFRNYGQLLGRKEATALIQKCRESIQIPQEGVIYKPLWILCVNILGRWIYNVAFVWAETN